MGLFYRDEPADANSENPAEGCNVLQYGESEGWQRWIGACDAENGGWNAAYELISTDQSLKGSEKQRQGEWQQRSTSLVQASWRQYHYRSLFPAGAVA
ncbi:hypothetical protein [Pseudomonas sp. EL_65y_Pfl2_R96]|uniref:hypothetical protein n=1 Tax=Pseudomonas sp. EL_65y_Pfl2_R96 TaxID=3088699 RepID=UPI0030DBB17A